MQVTTSVLLRLSTFLLLLWPGLEVVAQASTYIGIQGGYNLARASFRDPFRGLTMRIRDRSGAQGGLLLRTYFSTPYGGSYGVALQASFLYSQKGFRQIFTDNAPSASTRMDYIEVPLQTHISYTSWSYIPFINAGVFYERLVRFEQDIPTSIPRGHEVHPYKEGSDRRNGFGVRIGFGVEHRLFNGKIALEIVYTQSLQSYLRDNRLISETPVRSRLQLTSLTLSYLFRPT